MKIGLIVEHCKEGSWLDNCFLSLFPFKWEKNYLYLLKWERNRRTLHKVCVFWFEKKRIIVVRKGKWYKGIGLGIGRLWAGSGEKWLTRRKPRVQNSGPYFRPFYTSVIQFSKFQPWINVKYCDSSYRIWNTWDRQIVLKRWKLYAYNKVTLQIVFYKRNIFLLICILKN
jgi:hypothetical protein